MVSPSPTGQSPMPNFDFVKLDRLLLEFFVENDMADAGYVLVLANRDLRVGICSNVPDVDMVKGMLRGALKSVDQVEPEFFDSAMPAAQGNA
jgi:hypothetical protein